MVGLVVVAELHADERRKTWSSLRCSAHAQSYQVPALQSYKRAVTNEVSGIHDRCVTGGVYRSAQQHIGWTKDNCLKMDDSARQDCHYIATCAERVRYENLWSFSQGPTDRNTTATHKRSD